MNDCKPVATPIVVNENLKKEVGGKKVDATFYKSSIGNLLYLIATRPKIMFATSMLLRFLHLPSHFILEQQKCCLDTFNEPQSME
jgi:hypothetical protein